MSAWQDLWDLIDEYGDLIAKQCETSEEGVYRIEFDKSFCQGIYERFNALLESLEPGEFRRFSNRWSALLDIMQAWLKKERGLDLTSMLMEQDLSRASNEES